jgi:hypothetical protein
VTASLDSSFAYTQTRYETLLQASTGAYRIATNRSRGVMTRYRVHRILRDSNGLALPPGPAGNGEARAVLDLWRHGLLSTHLASAKSGASVVLTKLGHQTLAVWRERWRAHERRSTS